jgi:hypothetical protein
MVVPPWNVNHFPEPSMCCSRTANPEFRAIPQPAIHSSDNFKCPPLCYRRRALLIGAAIWRPLKFAMGVPATSVFAAMVLAAWGARKQLTTNN